MDQYKVTLTGLTPLLMHRDNIAFSERLSEWRRAPENKALSASGDDRSPPWTWIGYLYHDGEHIGVDADNLMTMLREGGAKVKTGKGAETFKKQTQSGIMIDQQLWPVLVGGKQIAVKPIQKLIGNLDFVKHLDLAEKSGFELLVKRARIERKKHIRVRPLFREWVLCGTVTVLDAELSGISREVLTTILRQSGALCGLCDWRPSSPASGVFGKFSVSVDPI